MSRRQVLRRSAAAGALVIGFDLSARGWATAADRAGQLARSFPLFDGVLHNLYPVGAEPLSPDDWTQHFGDSWPALVRSKQRYDPARILAPDHHVFR